MSKDPEAPRPHRYTVAGMLLGAVLISFSGVWVKLSHVTPAAAAFYRLLFGSFFLLPGVFWRREFRPLTGIQSALVLFAGLVFAMDLVLFHISINFVGPGLGTILPNFQVFVMAAVGVVLLKERLGAVYLLSIPLALAGLFLVVGSDWDALGAQYRLGIYAGLGTSICYSCFLLSMRRLQGEARSTAFFYVLMLVSAASAAFLAGGMALQGDSFAIPDRRSLLALLALGIFSQGIGWILISNALPRLRVSLSGLILLLQPALAFVWDVTLFDRPTSAANWIGVAVVLVAIYMGSARERTGSGSGSQ